MAVRDFRLPDLGEGLEEARVVRWLVAEGEEVALNQPLVEVETAKATVEIPSPHAGRILRLHAAPGEAVEVGAPLVTFEVATEPATPPTAEVEPATPPAAAEPAAPPGERAPVAATPAVRRLARDLGVDLAGVRGTGPGGRITREDVERAAGAGAEAERGAGAGAEAERVPLSPVRRAIAENLARAYAVPQVTTFRTVDCTHLEALRRELGVSPLPVVVRALCEVVRAHPMLNASWAGEAILLHRRIAVGIATDTERGLLLPVLRDPDRMGILEVARAIERLAAAARAGTLPPADLAGSTISVTNTGSYGSEFGTPILAPGHAVTLGLGAIAPRALVAEGGVVARPACTLSVTFDHRILDGADVGRALGDLVALLQDPERLGALPR
ncbi:MAG TPA: dihydrolipoamide acetyltransferase family protein [Actinomycetota bacterium]|nr:dihydrolipoamide acetyltransferase family protein [Actinomycetota bacterium]